MPIIRSAKKKLRKDRKKSLENKLYEDGFKKALKNLKKAKGNREKQLRQLYSKLDKAVKKRVIHKNKASRLKSLASKLLKAK